MELFNKSEFLLAILYTCTALPVIVEGATTNERLNEVDVDCKEFPDGHKFASPTNCSEYYVCFHYVAYLFQCPITTSGRLYFDSELQVCDWPWRVQCEVTTASTPTTTTNATTTTSIANSTTVRTTTSTTNETTTPQHNTSIQGANHRNVVECPEGSNGQKIASPTSCTEFYVCLLGVPYLFMCPNTTTGQLYFDPELEVCNWPWDVDCNITSTSTPRPTTTSKVTTDITTMKTTSHLPLTSTSSQNTSTSSKHTSAKPLTTTSSNNMNTTYVPSKIPSSTIITTTENVITTTIPNTSTFVGNSTTSKPIIKTSTSKTFIE